MNAEAVAAMRKMKELQADLAKLPAPARQPAKAAQAVISQAKHQPVRQQAKHATPAAPDASSGAAVTVKMLQDRIEQGKKAAVQLKQAGRQQEALAQMRHVKELQAEVRQWLKWPQH